MEWRAEELHRRRCKELGRVVPSRLGAEDAAELLLERWWEVCELRRNQRGQVEGRKDGETVAGGEERVGQFRDLGRRRG